MRAYDLTRPGGDLVIYGAGGFARETAQAVHSMNLHGAKWNLLGFIDDDVRRHGTIIDGTVVLGGRELVEQLLDASVVVCTGRPSDYVSRMRIVRELAVESTRYATIIHPSSAVSRSSSVGSGSVLLAHVTLTADVNIGAHVAVMPQVTLTHDDTIEDFATIASGVSIGGGARVKRCAYLGAGAIIGETRTIGAFSLIGMGAVVTHDVPSNEVWAGVPARHLRAADIPVSIIAEDLD
jgi:sugar O-acyltransferase (sialic acid O-acetyltransferase NeuD family)